MVQIVDYHFLAAAVTSFVACPALWFLVNHDYGVYIGLWVPSILALWLGVRVAPLACATSTFPPRK